MRKTDLERRFVADYLKIPEVARRLDVSEKTARRYVKAGALPSTFIGGAYRVTEEDLEEFVHRAEVKPEDASPKVAAAELPEWLRSRIPLEEFSDEDLQEMRRLLAGGKPRARFVEEDPE